jgi:predicted  nucleic acid-binding Zn-ribbon protein
MSTDTSRQRERMQQLAEFIELALQMTFRRKQELGLADDTLLDPEANIDQQIAILRGLFLEAEKSALPFAPDDANFWRILRARLQPVVLAYLTHERFIQTLDKDALALRPDALTEVYRERLNNSDRFRQFFFELTEKLDQEATRIERAPPSGATQSHIIHYKTAEDTSAIQGNVLKMLEKQLRQLEKEYDRKEALNVKANEEILFLKDTLHEKNDDIAKLRKQIVRLEEELTQHRLARDAVTRTDRYAKLESVPAAPAVAPPSPAPVVDTDVQSLQLKIRTLEQELAASSNAVYNAYMSSADLGIVILFMLSSFNCHTVEQLAQDMSRTISTFGLKTVVGVRKGGEYFYVASKSGDIQLKTLLDQHRGKGALVDINHLLLYQPGCCLLIQDPPRDDKDRYERIKDHISTLMKGAEARLTAIEAAQAVQRQKTQVEQLILRSHEVLQNFDRSVGKQQDKLARLINIFAQDLRKSLGIPPGDQKSIRLNMELKKLEDALREFFKMQDLIDPAFAKTITKVAQGIQSKQKGGDG